MMLADMIMVPYNDRQLAVVIVACVIIGFLLGAMAVGIFKTDKESEF